MREVTGSTWSFQIIIIFILIFACFLSMVLTYSKAYTIKNRMLTIVEKYEGIDSEAANVINSFASSHGYRSTAKCPIDEDNEWYGAINLDGEFEIANDSSRYYYCFRELDAQNGQIYYDIMVFYKFNLPFIGEITTFKISTETKTFIGNENRITKGE